MRIIKPSINKKTMISISIIMLLFMINIIYEHTAKPNEIGFCWEKQKSITRNEIRNRILEQLIDTKNKAGNKYSSVLLPIYYLNKSLTESDITNLISLSIGYGYSSVLTKFGLIEYNEDMFRNHNFSVFMKGGDGDDFEIITSDCCNSAISKNKLTNSYEFILNGFYFELSNNYGLSKDSTQDISKELYPIKMTYEIDSCAEIKKEISYQDPQIFLDLNREYRK